jgi:tetratricopeptide (TPR) repeat protein
MGKNLFSIFICLIIPVLCYNQDKEKLINNQSIIIEALKEEQIGHPEKAIELLEKLKYEADTKAVSNYYLAKLYRNTGKLAQAFEAIDESINTEPDNTWYLLLKANMCEENGRIEETAETYEKLSLIEKDNFSHFDNAAYFYSKSENFKKALDVLNSAEKRFGLIPTIAVKKSYVLTFLKKKKAAFEILEACHNQFPTNTELLIELIKSYLEADKEDKVKKYSDLLYRVDPNNEELKRLIKFVQIDSSTSVTKSPDQYIQAQDVSLDDKIKFLFLKLSGYISNSDKSGIQSLIGPAETLRKQFPNDPKPIALIGDIHFQLNDLLQAKESYVQSIKDGQVPYSVWDNLLFCLIHLNHWKTAKYYSEQCMELYPNQSFPAYVQVLSKFKLNQLNDILPIVEQLELMVNYNDHKRTEVLILKAKILSLLKNEEESEKTWKLAMETDHDYLAALEYCVFLAGKGETYPVDYFDKAMRSEFIHESFKLDKAAELFYNKKDQKKAKEYIDNSIAKGYCESADALLLASKIYDALGITQTANEFKDKARAILDSEADQKIQQNMQIK